MLKIFNITTETRDFVESFWKALPWQYQRDPLMLRIGEQAYRKYLNEKIAARKNNPNALPKYNREKPTLQEMARAVYDNFDKLKWEGKGGVLDNLSANAVEDFVFGKAGRKAGEASRKLGLSKGITLGPAI